MPLAGMILLAVALLLLALTARGYLRDRELKSQSRTWLTIAVIFMLVTLTISLIG